MRTYRTFILTDGTQRSTPIQAAGPGGLIAGRVSQPVLYLKDTRHQRYWRDPPCYSADDIWSLLTRIREEG